MRSNEGVVELSKPFDVRIVKGRASCEEDIASEALKRFEKLDAAVGAGWSEGIRIPAHVDDVVFLPPCMEVTDDLLIGSWA